MERIADYALLSNCQGSALVSRDGSVDWACLPSFDSPAVFARILGEPGGSWRVGTVEPSESRRAYAEDTMVLRTELRTASGTVALTDFMPLHPDDLHNDIGRRSPAVLGRIVEGIDGNVELDVEIAVRPEYELTTPLVTEAAPAVWRTRGGPVRVTVATDVALVAEHGVLRARFTVRAGEHRSFALHVNDPWRDDAPMPSPERAVARSCCARSNSSSCPHGVMRMWPYAGSMARNEITVDARRRTSLAKVGRPSDERYLVEEFPDGTLVLTPAVTLSRAEVASLRDPEIRAALDRTLGPKPAFTRRGSFAEFAEFADE